MKSNLRAILVTVIALALCLTALMPAAFEIGRAHV